MSYDLYFWKQNAKSSTSPEGTLLAIQSGDAPIYVDALPETEFVGAIKSAFPEIVENRTTNPEIPVQLICDPSDGGCFIVTWSKHVLTVEAHGVDGTHFNTLIDIADACGCRLYDPQTGLRYEG